MKCEKCGFPIKPGDAIMVYGVLQHRDCFGAMIDLVEAAEGRIAELEAQLAALKAGEWRPVSERPDSSACLYEVTVRASWDGDVFMTHGNLYMPHDGPDILRWRPAPPQE